jgi:hypothetical protein
MFLSEKSFQKRFLICFRAYFVVKMEKTKEKKREEFSDE